MCPVGVNWRVGRTAYSVWLGAFFLFVVSSLQLGQTGHWRCSSPAPVAYEPGPAQFGSPAITPRNATRQVARAVRPGLCNTGERNLGVVPEERLSNLAVYELALAEKG